MVKINKAEAQNEAGPAPDGVSALLRQAREKKGVDISLVSKDLRIRQEFLRAIEEERYGDLPGQAYALGFVRGYAEFLGLDSAEIVRRFKQESENFAKAPELVFRAPVNESNIPGFKILLVAVLLGGVGYGVWHGFHSGSSLSFDSGSFADRLAQMINLSPNKNEDVSVAGAVSPAIPSGVAERNGPAEEPITTAAAPSAAAAPAENASTPSTDSPGAIVAAILPTSSVLPSQSPQMGVPASPGGASPLKPSEERSTAIETMRSSDSASPTMPQIGAAGLAPGRVLLRADQDCWIEIRDQQGSVIYSRLLRKGETHPVPDQRGLVLTAGNAGALAVVVDGKILPPLGRMGMVRRDLSLDPDSLIASLAAGE